MPELLEKTLGSAGALCAFCLVCLWVIDLPVIYKYAFTLLAGLSFLAIATLHVLKSRRLLQKRNEQLQRHRQKQSEQG